MTESPLPPERLPRLFRPSSAHRWLLCHGSETLTRRLVEAGDIPVEADTEYTVLGTAKHEAVVLLAKQKKLGRIGPDHKGIRRIAERHGLQGQEEEIHEDASDAIKAVIKAKLVGKGDPVQFELPIALPPLFRGTADMEITHRRERKDYRVTLVDWKFGFNQVPVRNNAQMMLYGLMLNEGRINPVRLAVVQKDPAGEWKVSQWVPTWDDCWEFKKSVDYAIERAMTMHWSAEGMLLPSESACKWCDAKPYCPAVTEKAKKVSVIDIRALPSGMTLPKVYQAAKNCSQLVHSIEQHVLERGGAEGFTITKGRMGNRRWADQKKVEKSLKSSPDAWETKLLTPTQLEKKSPKDYRKVEKLVNRPEGKEKVELDASALMEDAFSELDGLLTNNKKADTKE